MDGAWDAIVDLLAFPAPDGGVDGAWNAYLVDDRIDAGARTVGLQRDAVARFDRASSFALVDRATPPGCAMDVAFARAVARGSLWRAAPGTDEGSAIATSEAVARIATPCAPPGVRADDGAFQAVPERAIVDATDRAYARGASRFYEWLDATVATRPGAIVLGLWSLAPTLTPAGAARWADRPTGFDVLRVSMKDAFWPGATIDDAAARFAAARATFDPAPRAEWHVRWPDHARRLASADAPAPTGASYVVVDHAGAPPGARLRLEAEWEDLARMRWTALEIDASGRVAKQLALTSTDRSTRALLTIESLDGVERVVVVGANVGSTEHPFDPDQQWWEPHGWMLTIEPM